MFFQIIISILAIFINSFFALIWQDYSINNVYNFDFSSNIKHTFLFLQIVIISYKDLFLNSKRSIMNFSNTMYLFFFMPLMSFKFNFLYKSISDALIIISFLGLTSFIVLYISYFRYLKNTKTTLLNALFSELSAFFVAIVYVFHESQKSQKKNSYSNDKFYTHVSGNKSYDINILSLKKYMSCLIFPYTMIYFSILFLIKYFQSI